MAACRVLVAFVNSLAAACGMVCSDQGSDLGLLYWECGVLATGPQGIPPQPGFFV